MTYRDVGFSFCAVECDSHWFVSVKIREESFGPEAGDEVFILEAPIKAEHSVEVQSQTGAVVHQHTKLLSLQDRQTTYK